MKDIIILGAGLGSRLRPITDTTPKLLIPVSGRTILRRSLDVLIKDDNVNSITIVTGYLSEKIEKAVHNLSKKISTIRNHSYKNTNNMHSLYLAFSAIDMRNDVIIMNGDCVYDPSILQDVINGEGSTIISDKSYPINDESMHIDVDNNGNIRGIAKIHQMNDSPLGDLIVSIDLYRIGKNNLAGLYEILENFQSRASRNEWTELALDILIKKLVRDDRPIQPTDINGKIWMEIDNHSDLEKANALFQNT